MNGLRKFSMHQADFDNVAGLEAALAHEDSGFSLELEQLDAETAARRHVKAALGSPNIASFEAAAVNGAEPEFKSLGVEKIPFIGTQTVKFRQFYRKIPVYGSLITVELDQKNNLVSMSSALGAPSNVDPQASIAPKRALNIVKRDAGYSDRQLDAAARLNYYYDRKSSRWRLVYIIEDILYLKQGKKTRSEHGELPQSYDYIIDAGSGEVVSRISRTRTMTRTPKKENAKDGLEVDRSIVVAQDSETNNKEMEDIDRNIHTHDFEFRDAFFQQFSLPGGYVANPPNPWDKGAVSAHANSTEVAAFIKDVLQRNGLDGNGGKIVSTVNCVFRTPPGEREWRNAARFRGQMIYGQRDVGGELVSYAVAKDVVAHELLHGLTDETADLEYKFESGALNESYSDIFGIIIANFHETDVSNWDWEMGEELSDSGIPLRDLSDPARRGQPAHMDDYVELDEDEDDGGVHVNSGIHNKAAFNVLTAKDQSGSFVFDPVTVARLYFLTLTQDLSTTSGFQDSRRGMVKWTKSMFQSASDLQTKVAAVEQAYDDVGIQQLVA